MDKIVSYNSLPFLSQKTIDRFWDKVLITANPNTCWDWNGCFRNKKKPYGDIVVNQQRYRTSRISYFLHNQKDPDDMCVLHTCDNTKCVNPNHLFLGTNLDNIKDKVAKGRHKGKPLGLKSKEESKLRGSKNPQAKFSEKDILEIRQFHKQTKMSFRQMANKYNVTDCTIGDIVNRVSWGHVN